MTMDEAKRQAIRKLCAHCLKDVACVQTETEKLHTINFGLNKPCPNYNKEK